MTQQPGLTSRILEPVESRIALPLGTLPTSDFLKYSIFIRTILKPPVARSHSHTQFPFLPVTCRAPSLPASPSSESSPLTFSLLPPVLSLSLISPLHFDPNDAAPGLRFEPPARREFCLLVER